MTKRGKKPKPTALKELAGKPGHRPLPESEPKPGPANLKIPRGRLPEDAKRLWKSLAKPLADVGVLRETDLPAFEMLCLHYAVARMGYEEIEEEGIITWNTQGGAKKHPGATVFIENSRAFRAYLTEFGLTPSSRVRIDADPTAESKSLSDILFEGVDVE